MRGSTKTLQDALDGLQGTYRNIDIRSIIGKQSNKSGWKCIFLKVRLNCDSKDQIEDIHRQKRRNLKLKNQRNFRFCSECRPINQLYGLLREINKELITINNITSKLPTDAKGIFEKKLEQCEQFSTVEEKEGYPHWFASVSNDGGSSTYRIVKDLGLSEDNMGIKLEYIWKWFDVPQGEWNHNNTNIVVMLPLYIKKEKITPSEKLARVEYKIHKSLLKQCSYRTIVHNGNLLREPKRVLNKLSSNPTFHEEIVQIAIPIKTEILLENSRVELEVLHRGYGLLFSDPIDGKELKLDASESLSPSFLQKLIIDVARELHSSTQKIKIHLDPFEAYIYHLLSQLPCFWMGLFENTNLWKKYFSINDVLDSVDFIILDKDSVILIECTKLFARKRGLVGEYEIKKLMHLKEKLISYGIKTTAILICDEYYKDNKSFFSAILKRFNQQTYFIFREGLENMELEGYTLTKPNDLLLYASKIQL